jgi:hypothetical protein
MKTPDNGNPRYRWFLLLLLPFIGLMCVPVYNRVDPTLWGIPFFYWYQFAWVFVSAAITAIVYLKSEPRAPSAQPQRKRG